MITEKKYKIRLDTFNLIKGLLMILIVLGHKASYYDNSIYTLLSITTPIMIFFRHGVNPAFFIIAGFAFRAMDSRKYVGKTFGELVKPYLYVMAAYAVCFPLFHYLTFRWWPGAVQETIRYLLAFLLGLPEGGKTFLGYQLYECSVVWFLLSLFISLNLLNGLVKLKEEKLRHVIALCSLVVGYVLAKMEFNYFCIPQGVMGLAYCYLGFLIKKEKLYTSKWLPVICVVLAVPSGIQGIWGEFHMGYGIFKNGFVECLLAACSGVLILFVGIILGNKEWKIFDPIKTVGVHTYWIMCIHAVDMSCIPWYYWSNQMKNHQILAYVIELALTALLFFVGCVAIRKIVKLRYKKSQKLMHAK